MKKIDRAAACHHGMGVLEKEVKKLGGVAVEDHDLARVRLTLLFGPDARVHRDAGDLGDGTNADKPPKVVSSAAALLYIRRARFAANPGLWLECIRDAGELKAEDLMPDDAKQALKAMHQMLIDSGITPNSKTPAKRIGVENTAIEVLERVKIADYPG